MKLKLIVTIIGVICIFSMFMSCKDARCRKDLSINLLGFWIVPEDPVVSIVIEKDSISWPDYMPNRMFSYKIVNDMILVTGEEGIDTIFFKQKNRDTLNIKYNLSERFTMLVRNN